jgi:hypothetical protein
MTRTKLYWRLREYWSGVVDRFFSMVNSDGYRRSILFHRGMDFSRPGASRCVT